MKIWKYNDLISSNQEINSYFDFLINEISLDKEIKNFTIYKKGLFNSDFVDENQLLDGVEKIRSIPAIIVQGRYDIVCPAGTAYELSQRWPEASLVVAPFSGHSAFEKEVTHELILATNKFAGVKN